MKYIDFQPSTTERMSQLRDVLRILLEEFDLLEDPRARLGILNDINDISNIVNQGKTKSGSFTVEDQE